MVLTQIFHSSTLIAKRKTRSSARFLRQLFQHIPSLAQVSPGWVCLLNQRDLLCSQPAFQILLPSDGVTWIGEALKPNQPIAVIGCRKSGVQLVLMLVDALVKVARHANIKRVAAAGDNVSEIISRMHGGTLH
jgi:hypothetical protein